ncbi:hypothetical protein [Actinoallomurus rhizosphaericola]|uniref:hypothetical protein n=1 Tax=Actinoallomurus rhizosphaericola TaxID=2952536 RepID=UPI00209291C6|nr:hypothetical protein [Actinoallomurus rhizosphaericola]MCO5997475.1 hypothetical protein [Actinoallomurus rhizosphaericola]
MTFEANGYLLSKLDRDPAVVERSLASLAKVLADALVHMTRLGRHDLAHRLDDLSRQLQASGQAIDDSFDRSFREVTGAAADACKDAAGPGGMRTAGDKNAEMWQTLVWSVVDMVTVRVGGRWHLVHRGGSIKQGQ